MPVMRLVYVHSIDKHMLLHDCQSRRLCHWVHLLLRASWSQKQTHGVYLFKMLHKESAKRTHPVLDT
jgi:hypothetical protein